MKSRDRYMFYKDRPEWDDVTPVSQDEDGRNIVRIAYSPQFVDANDYLRAVLLKDERTERALELTSTVLTLNPANYTVWEYRRRILSSLNTDLNFELSFVGKLIDETSKNYQLWHHRQWLVQRLAERENEPITEPELQNATLIKWGLGELEFTEDVISDDSKNYHSWQHRRWAVDQFKMPIEGELTFTESFINIDVYNNSAWNHRFVTVTKDEGLTPNVLEREIEFTQKMIRLAPDNESSWNYLYGLLVPTPCVVAGDSSRSHQHATGPNSAAKHQTTLGVVNETIQSMETDQLPASSGLTLVMLPASGANLRMMRQFAEQLASADKVAANSVALLGFLVEVYTDCIRTRMECKQGGDLNTESATIITDVNKKSINLSPGDKAQADTSGFTENESVADVVDLAVSICDRLTTEFDRIRAKYWRYRSRQLQLLATAMTT